MLFRNRLAVVFTALPLAFYAYACSDDDPSPSTADAGTDGGTSNVDGATTETPDSSDVDGGDGGDAGPELTCVGNPLGEDDGGTDGGLLLDVTALRAIAGGPFLDGPQWLDDDAGGAIVYSEVNNQVIVRNGPDGGARAILRETGANNLPIGNARSGDFIYTALARSAPASGGAILRMLVDGGDPTTLDAGAAANSPNDIVSSSKGFLYFTDPGFQTSGVSTGVFRLGPDGAVTTVQLFTGGLTMRADGIALTKDETTLYVSFFDVKQISKYTVDAEGVASNPQPVAFQPIDHPTALAVDNGGNLWIAEDTEGAISGRIEVIDPSGKKWGEIPFADSRPTGIAFGGADSKTVYVTTERDTAEGTLWVLTSRCPGVR